MPDEAQAASPDESAVMSLYRELIAAWNERNAAAFARVFSEEAAMVGFDGSQARGAAEVEAHLAPVFADHPTARFVTKVREVRVISPETAVLTAVAGMVPPGGSQVNAAVNAIQTLVAAKRGAEWRVEVFQNTPAAWHGREEARDGLTRELQELA